MQTIKCVGRSIITELEYSIPGAGTPPVQGCGSGSLGWIWLQNMVGSRLFEIRSVPVFKIWSDLVIEIWSDPVFKIYGRIWYLKCCWIWS